MQTKSDRDVSKLYVHSGTLTCTLKSKCIPCLYKLFPNGITDVNGIKLPSNVRPELCPRDFRHSKRNIVGLSEIKRPLPWYEGKKILTVGDGDFSFSLSIAKYCNPSLLIATSYESNSTIVNTYKECRDTLEELNKMNNKVVKVFHDVDARDLKNCECLKPYLSSFDLIIWNFPCIRDPDG